VDPQRESRTDARGRAEQQVRGYRQRRTVSEPATPVVREAEILAAVTLEEIRDRGSLWRALQSAGLAGLSPGTGAISIALEMITRSDLFTRTTLVFPVIDWTGPLEMVMSSEYVLTQGATAITVRVRSEVPLQAQLDTVRHAYRYDLRGEAPVVHGEYSWTDPSEPQCSISMAGAGGSVRVAQAHLTLPRAGAPATERPRLVMVFQPSSSGERHVVTCRGGRMRFSFGGWDQLWAELHASERQPAGFVLENWVITPGRDGGIEGLTARKTYSRTLPCFESTCTETTTLEIRPRQ
jgi:hypothetical protein